MKIIINTLDREAKVFLGIEYIAEIWHDIQSRKKEKTI
jgi:hypothetical protein